MLFETFVTCSRWVNDEKKSFSIYDAVVCLCGEGNRFFSHLWAIFSFRTEISQIIVNRVSLITLSFLVLTYHGQMAQTYMENRVKKGSGKIRGTESNNKKRTLVGTYGKHCRPAVFDQMKKSRNDILLHRSLSIWSILIATWLTSVMKTTLSNDWMIMLNQGKKKQTNILLKSSAGIGLSSDDVGVSGAFLPAFLFWFPRKKRTERLLI